LLPNCNGDAPISETQERAYSTTTELSFGIGINVEANVLTAIKAGIQAEMGISLGDTLAFSKGIEITANPGTRVSRQIDWYDLWQMGDAVIGEQRIPFKVRTGIDASISDETAENCTPIGSSENPSAEETLPETNQIACNSTVNGEFTGEKEWHDRVIVLDSPHVIFAEAFSSTAKFRVIISTFPEHIELNTVSVGASNRPSVEVGAKSGTYNIGVENEHWGGNGTGVYSLTVRCTPLLQQPIACAQQIFGAFTREVQWDDYVVWVEEGRMITATASSPAKFRIILSTIPAHIELNTVAVNASTNPSIQVGPLKTGLYFIGVENHHWGGGGLGNYELTVNC
jgi:hypothetical protein